MENCLGSELNSRKKVYVSAGSALDICNLKKKLPYQYPKGYSCTSGTDYLSFNIKLSIVYCITRTEEETRMA